MRHSDRVKEASKRALSRLFQMSKKDLDQRLSEREVGPIGHLLLATGSLKSFQPEEEYSWVSSLDVIQVKIIGEPLVDHPAADNDVRYHLLRTPYSPQLSRLGNSLTPTIGFAVEDETCAKAA